MYTFAICLALAAGAYAHMHGMNNYGHMNMGGMNQMGMQGWGMQGMNQNNQMGNTMNMLAQILGMGMNNMGMNNMGMNNMGGGRNMGMMNNMMGMLLQSLMQNMGGHHGNQGHESESSESDDDDHRPGASEHDMRRLEQMMRMEFAMEVAEFVMVYQEYQTKMKAFEGAVDGLCLGVEAAFEHAKRFNVPTNETFDAEVDRIGEEIDAIEDREEQINKLVEIIQNREEVFGAGFFKVATMVCTTGEEYLKAYQKMEKMEDDKDCDCHKK